MCSHGCTCVHMVLLTCKQIILGRFISMQTSKVSPFPTEKRNVVYTLCGARSGSASNKALQKMLASATLSTPSVAASGATTVWGNGPTAPPKTIIGKFVERTETAFASLPTPVNDGCLSSASGGTDWKKRHARQYN